MATAVTLLVVATTKFLEGAWITILVIPSLVLLFTKIHAHYREIRSELSLHGLPPTLRPISSLRVVVLVSGVHRGVVDAVRFAESISTDITGVYVELEPGDAEDVREKWQRFWPDIPIRIVPSPYRSFLQPLLKFLDEFDLERNDGQQATVILPEFVPAKLWQTFLHNQTAWLLKAALLYHRRSGGLERVIIDVPFHLRH
jgi:hypothetical protein